MKDVNRTSLAVFGLGVLALAAGCKKTDELPGEWSGRYRRTALLGLVADQLVVVAPRQLSVQNCQFNCGEPTVALTSVRCTDNVGSTVCNYTSEHCTGTISREPDGRLSVTARATPTTATGSALGRHNETCNNIRANLMVRAQ